MSTRRGELSIGQTVGLLLAALGLLYGSVVLGAVLRMSAQGVTFDEGVRQVTSEPFGLGLAQLFALGSVVLLGVRLAHGDRSLREALRIRPVRVRVAALAMIAGAALHFPLVELTSTVSDQVPAIALDEDDIRRIEQLTRIDGPLRAVTVPLTLVVIAPLTEELLFRGLLLPALRPRLGAAGALVLTSVLFGVFHVEPIAAIVASVAGFVLGTLLVRCRSVLPCLAFHGAFNAIPILLPEELIPIQGFNVRENEHLPLPIVLATFAAGAIALALLWRSTDSDEEPPGAGPSAPAESGSAQGDRDESREPPLG
jgi:membrane protease YdiL (CAAX protease family)